MSSARRERPPKANKRVVAFFRDVAASDEPIYLSAVSLGESRRRVELIRGRGDVEQAKHLEDWLIVMVEQFGDRILAFDADAAQVWGRLTAPDFRHPLDKQIAAIALVNDLTLVTRNTADFVGSGVRLRKPFI